MAVSLGTSGHTCVPSDRATLRSYFKDSLAYEMHMGAIMRTSSPLLFLLLPMLGVAGCGSSSGSGSEPGNGTGDPGSGTELFVRRGAGGLEVVEVDLASGTTTIADCCAKGWV